jgi:phosphoribosyl 1,2-cyclic phosphodiesterase
VALTASAVRRKVVAALAGAAGRHFTSAADLEAYVDTLGMAVAGSYGGHSSCVEIEPGGRDYVLCDMGSGLRRFGHQAIERHGRGSPQTYHFFMSHAHWDHIMGFPFFTPAYFPGNRIFIYGGHAVLEEALRRQQSPPSFPVTFAALRADIEFIRLEPGHQYELAGMSVRMMQQRHGGDSYGYRFESQGKVVVYSTDSEHPLAQAEHAERFIRFFHGADLVIFDAMYSLADAISVKADWGHSSNIVGVELCQLAEARQLCLFHHEPALDDAALATMLEETQRYEEITRTGQPLRVSAAYDGLELTL